ncbi:MAG: SDR family NAD(P)-dependent oxidoreductase [Proteobacteria bacterium]|nr:SDR family NAD(P)-dependent oxidoreductase [Pseudomonadota bacterium]MDA0951868.1 SDR family NAD(P)-dependent oxidoreductase [Pseudomonadota bacterium]
MDLDLGLFDLSGRTAIVTGSGRGLGKAMARGLAGAGAQVVICARSAGEVTGTTAGIVAAGGSAHGIVFDAARRSECRRLIDETLARFGGLDVMVVNHGSGASAPAEDLTDAQWEANIQGNLTSAFYACQEAARTMIAQSRGGSIVVTSSTGSLVGFEGLLAFGASKGGVDQMVRHMAMEWGRHGIRVNAINPGWTTHPPSAVGSEDDPAEQAIARRTPLGRRGRPEEMAGPAIFLASQASSFVTGITLVADGGWCAV